MSTGNANVIMSTGDRLATLMRLGQTVFHAADLARAWGIFDQNTLHTTLKRYCQRGFIFRIYRGFYALRPVAELNPWYVGIKALHGYGYVGAESVLAQAGAISQRVEKITLISGQSKNFKINGQSYRVRQLKDEFLYNDIGTAIDNNGVRVATPERAVADLLYFNPRAHFDGPVDWPKVKQIQAAVGYPPTPQRHRPTAP